MVGYAPASICPPYKYKPLVPFPVYDIVLLAVASVIEIRGDIDAVFAITVHLYHPLPTLIIVADVMFDCIVPTAPFCTSKNAP